MQKKKLKFKAIDLIILFCCLAGSVFSGAAFWQEYNHTMVKLNEEPVGTIIFKKNVAQRKFIDRGVWDRLRQTTPVYNGDTIRTTEQSEVIINFSDKTTNLTLYDSTMIQIFYDNKEGAVIDFSGGNIEIVSENKNIVISTGTSTIMVEGQARMNKSEEGLFLSVSDGKVSVDGAEVEAGGAIALDSSGRIETKPIIAMVSYKPSTPTGSEPAGTIPIAFSWSSFYFDVDTFVIVEIAIDRGFNQITESRNVSNTNSILIPLPNGNYWWRVYPASLGSREPLRQFYHSGALEVMTAVTPVSHSPALLEEFTFPGEVQLPSLPPIVFGRNTSNWDDVDEETIISNERTLSYIVLILSTNKEYKLQVEGHANPVINPDDIEGRLLEQTRELIPMSEVRARTVIDRLVKLGVDHDRLELLGFGGEDPVAAWEDVKNWRQNRRVEFSLFK